MYDDYDLKLRTHTEDNKKTSICPKHQNLPTKLDLLINQLIIPPVTLSAEPPENSHWKEVQVASVTFNFPVMLF